MPSTPELLNIILAAADWQDAIAGLLGSAAGLSYQRRAETIKWLPVVSTGVISAVYGAPVVAEWYNLSKATEYLCAAVIGLTAQSHLIPGIMSAASLAARIPSNWIKSRFENERDD